MLRQGFAQARVARTVAATRDDAPQKARAATAPRERGAELHGNRQARLLLAGTFSRVTGLRMVLSRGPGAQRWESWQQRQLKQNR